MTMQTLVIVREANQANEQQTVTVLGQRAKDEDANVESGAQQSGTPSEGRHDSMTEIVVSRRGDQPQSLVRGVTIMMLTITDSDGDSEGGSSVQKLHIACDRCGEPGGIFEVEGCIVCRICAADLERDELARLGMAVAKKAVGPRSLVDDGTTKISALAGTVACKNGQHLGRAASHVCPCGVGIDLWVAHRNTANREKAFLRCSKLSKGKDDQGCS